MVRTICPSLPMRIKALGVNGGVAAFSAASAAPIEGAVVNPTRRPPPSTALTLRKRRRERSTPSLSTRPIVRLEVMSGPLLVARHTMRRALDSFTYAHIRAAATDVPGHRAVDIAIRRVGLRGEQRRCGHDLP